MPARSRPQRLFVADALGDRAEVALSDRQGHYLLAVLRMAQGDDLLVFNGRDGEWRAEIVRIARRAVTLGLREKTRPQPPPPDLLYAFAPLKAGRLDYLVQKATEMGAGVLQPVQTAHTHVLRARPERMVANAIEAAEQCGVLSVPAVRPAVKLEVLLKGWEPDRRLIFCDEAAEAGDPVAALQTVAEPKLALLVGPEGGFSEAERRALRRLPFVTAIPLGPRVLRADTAGVAALALVQATVGDWSPARPKAPNRGA